jgi:hypothetical protein
MPSTYPTTLDSYSTKTDGVDDVMAEDVNNLQDAVVAIETELGTNPVTDWTDWTPVVTQSGNVTLTVTYAKYQVVRKKATLLCKVAITGSGTGANAIVVSGWPSAINPSGLGAGSAVGIGTIKDTGVQYYYGLAVLQGATSVGYWWQPTSAYLGINPNFALANTDEMHINVSWMIA